MLFCSALFHSEEYVYLLEFLVHSDDLEHYVDYKNENRYKPNEILLLLADLTNAPFL